jgi:hypothetical protein
MNWLTGGKQGKAKRLISKLTDVPQRDHAAQDLMRLAQHLRQVECFSAKEKL